MKTCSLLTFALVLLLFTGCTDRFAGADLETDVTIPSWEEAAGKGFSKAKADLSLRLTPVTAGPPDDSLIVWLSAEVHNEGPDKASGVEVAFRADMDSLILWFADGNGTSANPSGGNPILWDSLANITAGQSTRVLLGARFLGTTPQTIQAEIIASDARDPDSVPGDWDPDQDDHARLTLYPEVPPCPDCPY